MALRTPNANGLAVPPNAVASPNDPAASTEELQAHRFWGRYTVATALPNAAGNAAADPAYSLMRPGDVAWVQADGLLYQLQDRGTLGGSDAVWAVVGGGGSGAQPDPIDWFPGTTELWRWNQTDLSQFDIANPLRFRDDLGLPTAGSITPAVAVGAGRRGENWLTFTTAAGFKGGLVYRILEGGVPFSLPERYYVYSRYAQGGVANECGGVIMPFGLESPSAPGFVEGALGLDGYTGQNSYQVYVSHFNGAQTQLYFSGITPDLNASAFINPAPSFLDVVYIGGVEGNFQARRPIGENPTANWWWRRKHRYDSGTDHGFYRFGNQTHRLGVAGAADPTSWNGLDMDQAFVGIYTFNALTGPFVAYSDIRIYSFNPDAPGT